VYPTAPQVELFEYANTVSPLMTGYYFPITTMGDTNSVIAHLSEKVELFEYANTVAELFLIMHQTSSFKKQYQPQSYILFHS
jgi:hypothetical protein